MLIIEGIYKMLHTIKKKKGKNLFFAFKIEILAPNLLQDTPNNEYLLQG